MQRAVIYVRVGATRQPGQDVHNQLNVCREFCSRWSLSIVTEYVDEGFSGRFVDRPAFSSMVATALNDERDFDVIVTMDYARFLDDPKFCRTYEDLLRGNGVALKAVSWETVVIPSEHDADLPYDLQRTSHPGQPSEAWAALAHSDSP